MRTHTNLKKIPNYMWQQKGLAVALLVIITVATNESLLWPGGFGIQGKESKVETIERDPKGNITKQIEVTQTTPDRTLWDWLSLLGVPISLTLLGTWLQSSQRQQAEYRDKIRREQAESKANEEALQAYIDRISTFLLDKNLLTMAEQKKGTASFGNKLKPSDSKVLDSAVDVVRAQTLSLLRRFGNDGIRKGSTIRFLVETDVLKKLDISLDRADLSHADLSGVNLAKVSLKGTNLSYANLSYANLNDTEMQGSNLQAADLTYSKLEGCNLLETNLKGTNFREATHSVTTTIEMTRKMRLFPESVETEEQLQS